MQKPNESWSRNRKFRIKIIVSFIHSIFASFHLDLSMESAERP